ncbi:MAG: DUF4012 domain-containing protein [Chloroflexota bacterium]
MQHSEASPMELMKLALANLRQPEALNNHPWAVSISGPKEQRAGEKLVDLVTRVFRKMIPSGPPRAGKRLDTRWGAFGILAAQYFAPLLLGTRAPSSLREGWESLDRSILFFVYGRTDGLSEEQQTEYRFAGNEIEPAPNSTLSDWHRKGVEQLTGMVSAEIERVTASRRPITRIRRFGKTAGIILGVTALILALFLGVKAWGFYRRAQAIEKQVNELETYLSPTPQLEQIPEISSKVHNLRTDLDSLQDDAQPYLWLAPYFGWLPKYGGDLSEAEDLLALAQNLITAADEGLTAVTSAVETTLQNDQPLEIIDLVLQLQDASPRLLNAQLALVQAQAARERIDVQRLSPRLQKLLTERVDPLFESLTGAFPMEDALALVRIAPTLLGSGKAGPQTYLILLQNEDELRPTGGFLTAAGSAVVKDGRLISINIESSDMVDDLSKPYPVPPWQFEEFMNIEMLLFRDSNWFTDFPTTVSWAEYFYSYGRATSSDGVIAIDMQVIVRLLETLGPVHVEGVDFPIDSENVMDYMRSAEDARPEGVIGKWDRKQFLGRLAKPLLEKILQARGQTWTTLVPELMDLLDERHILLQFDEEEATKLLERRNWDGAVRIAQSSDFLMLVDTNMGYNKSNAVMEMTLTYEVNLEDLTHPTGSLTVMQTNRSMADVPCRPFASFNFLTPSSSTGIREPFYNIDECHWSYLRLYLPAGTELQSSTPREIPEESTMLGETIPARTDNLGSEDIPGMQVYGMMVITPTGQSTETGFDYALPAEILTRDEETDLWVYRLKVQKQPGTEAHPFLLSLRLPPGAQIEDATASFSENGGVWTAQLDLLRDLMIEVRFIVE